MTTTPLWRWRELCRAVGVPETDGPDVASISIDSRAVEPGALFIALSGDPGPRFHGIAGGRDGHQFLDDAISAGAVGVMVKPGTHANVPTLSVADTLDGLWSLGIASRDRMQGQVTAITGSAGKTTARQWLEKILTAQAVCHASTGSFNNHWGVPLSLARMPRDVEFGVFEVGTNHPGEIGPLSRMVSPQVALLLNVLPAHIGNFANLAALREEKLSIAAGLGPSGTLVLPVELASEVQNRRVLAFGTDASADIRGEVNMLADGMALTFRAGNKTWETSLPVTGEHRASTALAVFATLYALGAGLDAAMDVFPQLDLPAGRGDRREMASAVIIDDSYNANPVSMQFALRSLAAEPGPRIAILGEMLELGADGPALHAGIEQDCGDLDGVITVGEGFADWGAGLGDRYWQHASGANEIDLDALTARLRDQRPTVLVKGSNKVFWAHGFVDQLARALESN